MELRGKDIHIFSYVYILFFGGKSNKLQGLAFLNTRDFKELLALLIHGTCILFKAD